MLDLAVIGPLSKDSNIDADGTTYPEVGGAVVYATAAASALGYRVAAVTKMAASDVDLLSVFALPSSLVCWNLSAETTTIRNRYLSADRERRESVALAQCDPFTLADMPGEAVQLYQVAGSIFKDTPTELILALAEKSPVALDMQGLLRWRAADGSMVYRDFSDKREVLPRVRFLKVDTAEAEVLTGLSGDDRETRVEMAKRLAELGAAEVMLTNAAEVLVYAGADNAVHTCPLRPQGLSGRTGRGDTVFGAYICERLASPISAALLMATAAVSLKMESPGPLACTRQDVEAYLAARYADVRDELGSVL
ncbi:MAG: PfkB family carbohydrate kinase [Propionibacteriaceae bacterium]|jgi:sugar/nucleoside kinase (ribokinase family)|nr:PfkB family carbohydrate kinase [Propionibacteriaceae bacterium]